MSQSDTFLATARQVVTDEARALDVLAEQLDEGFAATLRLMLSATGRIIVSGIGKSGHIGRKIAATLASTGTPAHFVHPAEASHGDLGMVAKGDVVLAISNSGEAPELANLVAYTRRFGIPLIGLSSRPDSSLMKAADAHLLIPNLGEACGYGIVPTISTTLTLAMGDALAVALMKYRDFRAENFRDFHPGGKLGAQLTRVRDLMHPIADVPMVADSTPMAEALAAISRGNFGMTGVTDAMGNLAGIITDGDVRRQVSGLLDRTAGEVMTRNPKTIGPDALAEAGAAIMNRAQITSLFVTEGPGPALGLLHIHDCLRAGLG